MGPLTRTRGSDARLWMRADAVRRNVGLRPVTMATVRRPFRVANIGWFHCLATRFQENELDRAVCNQTAWALWVPPRCSVPVRVGEPCFWTRNPAPHGQGTQGSIALDRADCVLRTSTLNAVGMAFLTSVNRCARHRAGSRDLIILPIRSNCQLPIRASPPTQ